MNDHPPKLSEAGFGLLSHMVTGRRTRRLSVLGGGRFMCDGEPAHGKMVERLIAQGYLEYTDSGLFVLLTARALALTCPFCRGHGLHDPEGTAETHEQQRCPKCSGRRIIAPGTDHTPLHVAPVKARKPRLGPRPEGSAVLKDALGRLAAMKPASIRRDPSPTEAGLYWLALDDGGEYLQGSPRLVRIITEDKPIGLGANVRPEVRIDFLGGPEMYPIFFDQIEDYAEAFAALKHGSIHRVSWPSSIGGFIPSSGVAECRLTWLGRVIAPDLPELAPAEPADA